MKKFNMSLPQKVSNMNVIANSMFHEIKVLIENYATDSDFEDLKYILKKILNYILLDKELARAITLKSYRHQLGFNKFTLHTFSDGSSLRLHFWDNKTITKEDIHSHCADFKSLIVHGSIVNNIYRLIEGADNQIFNYSFDVDKSMIVAKRAGYSAYELIESKFMNVTDYYFQSSQLLHNVNNVSLNTITISVWKEREFPALVLKEKCASAEDCNYTVCFSEKEMENKLNSILEIF